MEATAAKIVSMILLGGISLFLGLLPLLLKKCNVVGQSTSNRRGKFVVSAMSCFGGGVILATCFTHMLPEVNTFMKKNIQEGHFPDTGMLIIIIIIAFFFKCAYARKCWRCYAIVMRYNGRIMFLISSIDRFGHVWDSDVMRLFHDLHRRRGHPRVREQIAKVLDHINQERKNEKSTRKKFIFIGTSKCEKLESLTHFFISGLILQVEMCTK